MKNLQQCLETRVHIFMSRNEVHIFIIIMSSDAITGDRGEALANIREKLTLEKAWATTYHLQDVSKSPAWLLCHMRDCGQRNTHSEQCYIPWPQCQHRGQRQGVQNPTNLGWNQSPSWPRDRSVTSFPPSLMPPPENGFHEKRPSPEG